MAKSVVQWKHRWTFLMAATGSAFGLGNIWKLPYITGLYGGGAFIVVFLACIVLIGVPLMMAESLLGRMGRADPVTTMQKLSQEENQGGRWTWVGGMGVITGLLIMMFYSVVAGWVLAYVVKSFAGSYSGFDATAVGELFAAHTSEFAPQFMFHTIFTVLTGIIVAAGITRGIGRGVETMMPILFLFILVLLGYSMATGDFNAAVDFMFIPDFSKLSTEAVLVAMGHAFFSLSLGMGAIMAYGAYMPQDASISKTILTVALLDTAFGLLMGLCIFPLIFANSMEPTSGPGLLFVSLPIAFATMPFGVLMGSLFFLLVSLAALTSSISLIEPGVAWLEKRKTNRVTATVILCLTAWIGGMLCIGWSQVFDFLDALTSRYLLPLGGLAIACFAGWVMQPEKLQQAADMNDAGFRLWQFLLRYISPLGIILIFLHSFGLFA